MLTSGTGSKINLGPNPKMNDPSFSHLVFSWLANCYTHTRIPTGSTFAHLSACPDFHLNFQAKKDRVEKRRPIQFQTLIRSFVLVSFPSDLGFNINERVLSVPAAGYRVREERERTDRRRQCLILGEKGRKGKKTDRA